MADCSILLSSTCETANGNSSPSSRPNKPSALRLIVSESSSSNNDPPQGALLRITKDSTAAATTTTTTDVIDSMFPDGYISKTVSDLTELRDALNRYLPRQQQQQEEDNPLINDENDDDDITHQQEAPTMDEMRRFELFMRVIEHEDDLLNHRVSWIILAQSFLMAAYITSGEILNSLRFVTAGVGLLTVVVTLPAILAAGSNIEVQQQVYFRQISSDERCMFLHGHVRDLSIKPPSHEVKNRLEKGHMLPNMAFRSRRSVKILRTAILLGAVQCAGWIFLLIAVIQNWNVEFG
eukprot:scaffold1465_cov93-Cylindrotheca_fusiformis.AAC.3